MRTYTVLYAEDVPHYGTREFDAADDTLAIERARAIAPDALSNYTNDPDHNDTLCRRIVHIEGPEGIIAEDIYLGPNDSLRDRAPDLAQALDEAINALKRIADTAHYENGEPCTSLESREIADIYADAAGQIDYFEAILKAARG